MLFASSCSHPRSQIFGAYADKKSVDLATLRFMSPDGDRIKVTEYVRWPACSGAERPRAERARCAELTLS